MLKVVLCFSDKRWIYRLVGLVSKNLLEVNPITFLDTKLIIINGAYKFIVYQKKKLLSPWTLNFKTLYMKYNQWCLHLTKRIYSNFDEEIPLIKEKFMKADYPLHFSNSVINERG